MNVPNVSSEVQRKLKKATDKGQPAFTPAQVDAIAEAIQYALKRLSEVNRSI